MTALIIACSVLGVAALAGLAYFIYNSVKKTNQTSTQEQSSSLNSQKEKTKEQQLTIENPAIKTDKEKTKEQPMLDNSAINSAINYLESLKGFGDKAQMTEIFKDFKNADENTRNAYIKGIDGAINAQNIFIKQGQKGESLILKERVPLYQERIKNLNCLKEYLLNSK